jgi:hypothetical protein
MMTKPGDRVVYRPFGGGLREGTIVDSSDDIKNGYPGFDMDLDDGSTVWGYDDQIVTVNGITPTTKGI